MQANDTTPVLVGVGQAMDRPPDTKSARPPIELLIEAASRALRDASPDAERLGQDLEAVAGLRFISDSPEARSLPFAKYLNPGLSVARALGAEPREVYYLPSGGNTPQLALNHLAEQIANGEFRVAMLVGGECWGSVMQALAEGAPFPDWNDDPKGPKTRIGKELPGSTESELAHGMLHPVNTYPMLEQAWRAHKGRTLAEHQKHLGELMAPLTEVAAKHKLAWFPQARSAAEISTPAPDNRWVGFPYTKYMNAVMKINQAGAVVMMAAGEARARGIPESQWVYLHGCAEANDIWYVSERPDLHRSHALHGMGKQAFAMAGWSAAELDYVDIYSCFPVAVEVACAELGIAEDNERGLSVTGGLPYFGGAGNAYALMAITTMVGKLRAKPGSKGLVTANGWYLTKHALGLYSTAPVAGKWRREKPAKLQSEIDALPRLAINDKPEGAAQIETYTVAHVRKDKRMGIVLGRLLATNERFVAHTPPDDALLDKMMREDYLGRKGQVTPDKEGRNLFVPQR